jgi:hypothetical protein
MSKGQPKTGEKIILTDWPKFKYMDANYRGIETEELLDLRKELFHTMMCSTAETAGGWVVSISYEGINDELRFRKALPENDGISNA